jgi:predicted nucleic acid-binding protein
MAVLVDTCVLVAAFHPGAAEHLQVRQALRQLRNAGEVLVITPQNCAELWNVSTRPMASNGRGLSAHDVQRMISIASQVSTLLYETPEAFERWRQLVERHDVKGVAVHDARLVAVMLAYGVTRLLTLNVRDFKRYAPEGITIATPHASPSDNG